MCPEYSSISLEVRLGCPNFSHLVSLSPREMYFFISFVTCAVLPASYIVLMFQVASFLGVEKGVGHTASFRLSLQGVIVPREVGPIWPRLWHVVDASVT